MLSRTPGRGTWEKKVLGKGVGRSSATQGQGGGKEEKGGKRKCTEHSTFPFVFRHCLAEEEDEKIKKVPRSGRPPPVPGEQRGETRREKEKGKGSAVLLLSSHQDGGRRKKKTFQSVRTQSRSPGKKKRGGMR